MVPSSSLVPAGDNTLLFVNSGMVPFKDALTGAEKRSYTRAVNFQRCLRVAGKHNDFEEVGRSPRHHTFFEMLGNWSFGDYFKREAIHWAWDFLTKDLGIPGERLAATVYTTDDDAHAIWKDEIGLPPERLVRWGDFPSRRREELVADGRHRAMRAVLGDPFRSRAAVQRGRPLRPGPLGDVPALARDLEPRVHAVRAPPGSVAHAAARAGRRHGHGPGAADERRPAGAIELRHRPLRRDPRADARAVRARPGRVRGRALQLPGHRRPLAGDHVPARGRRPALERGARLRRAGGSSGARSATAGCSGGRSRSSPRRRRSSSRRWATSTATCARTRTRSSAGSPARRSRSAGRSRRARTCSRRRSSR